MTSITRDEIYQKYRLWPSFVGARNSQDIHGPGVPPVRLWPAQQHYIRSVQLSNPSFELETNSMNKGKRESPFDVYSDRSESSVLVKLLQNHLTVARSLVFKDLMDRGYLVGPGDVYGGDYTIYNDDPSQEHAMATIRVVGSKQWKYLDGSVDGHYLDINEFEDPKRCNAAYECSEQKGTVEETAPALECAPTTLNCSVDTSETTISSAAASTNAEDSTAHRLSDTVISCREFLAFARVQNQVRSTGAEIRKCFYFSYFVRLFKFAIGG